MSQEIDNRAYRQQVIRDLLAQLHAGKSVDEVKQQFDEAFSGVSVSEISAAEQALISEGLPIEEVQRLCDVHAAVFKGSIEEIHRPIDQSAIPGHPAHTLKAENRAFERLIEDEIRPAMDALVRDPSAPAGALQAALERLLQIDLHYVKKENLLFPYMEAHGITAPPKVMWGVDDDIRLLVKAAIRAAAQYAGDARGLKQVVDMATEKLTEMIFKEENILLPMVMEILTQQEWKRIADESEDLGYSLIPAPPRWSPAGAEAEGETPQSGLADGVVTLPTGVLKIEELTRLLDTLPIDITFVDKDDAVKYFSQSAERVFPRTKAIIGRKVINCHPPGSMPIVQNILDDFKAGRKDHEDFWIDMRGKFILIRYYAVRGADGAYLGTLEVTQDIAPIQAIQGEKRLVSDA